jgi:hypothetical protein
MRLRVGVAMAPKGGRTGLVVAEVLERRTSLMKREYSYIVGHVDRITPPTVEEAADRVVALVRNIADEKPCVMVDTTSPQGVALRVALNERMPAGLHKAHAMEGAGIYKDLFSGFLQTYSASRVAFEPGLDYRGELDRSLVFYMGGGVAKHGFEITSEDEALVVALGLALFWPRHGGKARILDYD